MEKEKKHPQWQWNLYGLLREWEVMASAGCRVPSAVVVINVYRECVRVWEEYILGHRFSWYLHLF